MKKRLRKKMVQREQEARLLQSINQMTAALDGDLSHVTVHNISVGDRKKK